MIILFIVNKVAVTSSKLQSYSNKKSKFQVIMQTPFEILTV